MRQMQRLADSIPGKDLHCSVARHACTAMPTTVEQARPQTSGKLQTSGRLTALMTSDAMAAAGSGALTQRRVADGSPASPSPASVASSSQSSQGEVNIQELSELKQWIMTQTTILKRWKNRYVVVNRDRIRAFETERVCLSCNGVM